MLSFTQKVRLSSPTLSTASRARQRAAQRRAIDMLRAVLILGVILLSAFTVGRIFLAGVVLGGVRDLMTLYGATALLALSLAILVVLKSQDSDRSGRRPRTLFPRREVSGVFALGLQDENWKSGSSSSIGVSNGRP
jgi:hypothetical protein